MKIKVLDGMSTSVQIWDKVKKRVLFRFVNGEFETEDQYIIDYWNKYYLGGVKDAEIVEPKVEPISEDESVKLSAKDEKLALETEIKTRFGKDIDRRWSLKKIKAYLVELESGQ